MDKHPFFLIGFFLGVMLMIFGVPLLAQDDPEPTIVEVCYGALPDECGGNQRETIQPGKDVLVDADKSTFRHVKWISGPQACIHTGNKAGGRECHSHHEGCGYISEGYNIWGISGMGCTAAGVAPCEGLFCY